MKKIFHFGFLSEENKIAFNLTLLHSVFFSGWAFLTYSNLYLQELGFSASSIGTLVAINNVVAIFATMFWGMFSDRINSVKKTLFILIICMAFFNFFVPYLPVGLACSVPIFFVYFSFLNVFKSSLAPMLDNMTIRTCTTKGVNYGRVRATGSFIFAVASLLTVAIVKQLGVGSTFLCYGACAVMVLVVLWFSHDPKSPVSSSSEKKKKLSLKPLLRNYHFVCFLIFCFVFYSAIGAELSFMTFFMEDMGIETNHFGTFLAVRALFEIPILLIIIKLRKKFRLKYMLIIGVCLMSLQCALLSLFARDLLSMCMCGSMFGFGNGLILGCVPAYLYKLAPDNLKASAQSMFASVCAVSGIVGNLVGGIAYEALGASLFYMMVGVFMGGSALLFLASILFKKTLVNPADILG